MPQTTYWFSRTITNYVTGRGEMAALPMELLPSDDHLQLLWVSLLRSRRPRRITQFSILPPKALCRRLHRHMSCHQRGTPKRTC